MNETAATKPLDMSLVKPAWICIAIGCAIMLIPIPFTSWIGWLTGLVAGSVLAIINLTRGIVGIGVAQLICAVVGTFICYWIGLAILTATLVGAVSTMN